MQKIVGRFLVVLMMLGASIAFAQEESSVPQSRGEITLSFAPVVEKAAPAVVNIYTRKVVKERMVSPFFNDPFFRQFFGDQFSALRQRERVQNSLGSGVLVAADGLVVTNNHVVADADEIMVVLKDGREFPAKAVAREERLDLALLRIDTKGESLPVLEFRNSDDLKIGDLVLAIGNPFGVGQTVTSGIISGLARTQTGINDLGFFIQTDAAINPGNSGGALVSLDGRLVGINTAIYSRTGGSVGIGFAIPSNMVQAVVSAEASGGKFIRPWAGMAGERLSADIAKTLGLEKPGGVVVTEIFSGGPADKAGLKPGDVILSVNDKPIEDPQGMAFRLATLKVGQEAMLTLWRRGAISEVALPLIAPPKDPAPNETLLNGRQPLQGALVANLSPALAQELSVDAWKGVIILKIRANSFADGFGMSEGDLIKKINGVPIDSVKNLVQNLADSKGPWNIEILRDGKTRTIKVQ